MIDARAFDQCRRAVNFCRRTIDSSLISTHLYEVRKSCLQNNHVRLLPQLGSHDESLLARLKQDGIAITSLESLLLPLNSSMLSSAQFVANQLRQQSVDGLNGYLLTAQPSILTDYPEIFNWGLQERLLNVLEHYLLLPVAYHGFYIRRDLANSILAKSRLWHTDMEDSNMLKILVYLQDMDELSGPFEYFPKLASEEIRQRLGYQCGYLRPNTVEKLACSEQSQSCIGPSGTVVIVDTGMLIHRGRRPERCDRYSVFFDYTSQIPRRPYYCKPSLPREELARLSHHWTERQHQAVFWR